MLRTRDVLFCRSLFYFSAILFGLEPRIHFSIVEQVLKNDKIAAAENVRGFPSRVRNEIRTRPLELISKSDARREAFEEPGALRMCDGVLLGRRRPVLPYWTNMFRLERTTPAHSRASAKAVSIDGKAQLSCSTKKTRS